MKILHTSDLHIGKKLDMRFSRIEEQRAVLNDIARIAKDKDVDVLLVSGDVYDVFTPSAEAERMFFEFLSEVTKVGISVITISGNHDDPTRLYASAPIASYGGVFFGGDESVTPTPLSTARAKFVTGGSDWFVFEKDGEKVYFACLPYPTEMRMKEKLDESETYEQKVARYIAKAFENNVENLPAVLLAHIFMLGGEKTDGERNIDLGGVRIVSQSVIPDNCVYTALGHLHKRQTVSHERNIIYCGSPLPYSFDEAGIEKSVAVFDIVGGKVENYETVQVSGYKGLYRISATSVEDAIEKLDGVDGYAEITLTVDKSLTRDELKTLNEAFPLNVLKIIRNGGEARSVDRRDLSDEDLFKEFYFANYGAEPDGELVTLFLKYLGSTEESDETENS